MNEIGGYFGLEKFSGPEYYGDLIAVNSGRNALLYVARARKYHKLYIPRFLCDSVSELCRREGLAYEEYSIDRDFLPVFDKNLKPGEAIYIVNFYGQITNSVVQEMKARWERIVFDNVQAFFQKPVPGVDTVYSCRKFFGVPDGGYVSCTAPALQLELDNSRMRMTHILGRFEVSGSAFYSDFQKNDEQFYEMPLREMSPLTRNILRGVDYDTVRQVRNRNYRILDAALGKSNALKLHMPDGPYCYPLYCTNGMGLKRALAAEKIYVPTLWPNVLDMEGSLEQDFARNILPLPCDQRYDEEDMQRMIRLLVDMI